ncbi:hypothetical protein [Streptomyces sp. NPDC057257]|uniref:hypothetical protein n=1 Tax=Streptomyces sp. NPDC057257 TaxID=3346071 RepID=UPI00364435CB
MSTARKMCPSGRHVWTENAVRRADKTRVCGACITPGKCAAGHAFDAENPGPACDVCRTTHTLDAYLTARRARLAQKAVQKPGEAA